MTLSTQRIDYRDNVTRYFLDTEFYEDGATIDLISIGVVADDGREFYAVNQEARLDRVSDWVRQHVLVHLPPYKGPWWMTRKAIMFGLTAFVREDAKPVEFWGYYADYDWIVLCQLFGTMMSLPKHFPQYCLDLQQLSYMLGSPRHEKQKTGEHNSLEDARWHRDLFETLRAHRPTVEEATLLAAVAEPFVPPCDCCERAAVAECVCVRCSSEPTAVERFHACATHRHEVLDKHRQIRQRDPVWRRLF